MYASDHGTIIYVFNDNRTFNRAYDAKMLTRIWIQLGAEKFRERYKFDWAPSEELLENVKAEQAKSAGGARA